MVSTIKLTDYLIGHARAAFALMSADPSTEGAEALLAWLRREHKPEFTRRDAYRALRARFTKADDIDRPLAVLTELGYIRPAEEAERSGPGRPASLRYEVHPTVQNGQNCQKGAARPLATGSGNSVHSVQPARGADA
jgi:replicative DNA helicase